uniref:Uncharacterized protein n=1 Tax=Romanomermis culicivorax TaxID=13658 RepID=A0A915J3Z3_ROMCU
MDFMRAFISGPKFMETCKALTLNLELNENNYKSLKHKNILRASNAVRFIALIKEQLYRITLTTDALCNINFFVHDVRSEADSDSSHSPSVIKSDKENGDIDDDVICEDEDF